MTLTRECAEYSSEVFNTIHKNSITRIYSSSEGTLYDNPEDPFDVPYALEYPESISSQIVSDRYYACPPNGLDTAVCHPYSCVYNGICYGNATQGDFDIDGIIEMCIVDARDRA